MVCPGMEQPPRVAQGGAHLAREAPNDGRGGICRFLQVVPIVRALPSTLTLHQRLRFRRRYLEGGLWFDIDVGATELYDPDSCGQHSPSAILRLYAYKPENRPRYSIISSEPRSPVLLSLIERIAKRVNDVGHRAKGTMMLTGPYNLHAELCAASRHPGKRCGGGTYAWARKRKYRDGVIWGGPGADVVGIVDGLPGNTFQMVECKDIVDKIPGYTASHD